MNSGQAGERNSKDRNYLPTQSCRDIGARVPTGGIEGIPTELPINVQPSSFNGSIPILVGSEWWNSDRQRCTDASNVVPFLHRLTVNTMNQYESKPSLGIVSSLLMGNKLTGGSKQCRTAET